MSRIFDALRRSEQEKGGPAPVQTPQDNRLRNLLKEVETRPGSLDRVGRVVCRASADAPIVTHQQDHGVGAEKFRVLCHRLRRMRRERAFSKVLVTSAVAREGKTFVALNLALTLAAGSARVVLVDTDMRQSGLNRILGLPILPGLADCLERRIELHEAYRAIDPFGLYYVPAGTASTNPMDLLQGPVMGEFMAQTASAFDWVILDSPPLNPVADAHCLSTLADGVFLVVRSGLTTEEDLQQGLRALEGAFVAGVVLNGSNDHGHNGYYYYYSAPRAGRDRVPGENVTP